MAKSIYEDPAILAKAEQLADALQRDHPALFDAFTHAVRLDAPLHEIAYQLLDISVVEGLAPYPAAAVPIVSVARYLRRRELGLPV